MPVLSNLRLINLNYLPVLREVLRQRSFSVAAKKLHISQPAISNTIRVMRGHFDDELLVRSGKGMELTTKGEELLQLLEIALSQIETVVGGVASNLGTATGTVRIATVDNIIGAIAGPLSRLSAEEAPHVQIELLVASRNMATELQTGGIDIAITSTIMMNTLKIAESIRCQLRSEILGDERLVCIGPRDDASLAAGLTWEEYIARPHASFIVDPDHHHTVERQWLADLGLNPNSRIRTASNLSLPDIVATSGCLSLVPESLARKAVAQYPIQIFDPPMQVPDIRWVMVWHDRSEIDAIVKWAINALIRCASTLLSPDQARSIS